MAKKDLRSVAASLSAVAATLPTQNVATPRSGPVAVPDPAPAVMPTPTDPLVQFSFDLRKSQRRELQRLAADADMTMRAFILDALREKGLKVTGEDLVDLRRKG